ncbi:hypothetical protein [Rahnella variigena]|jgi:hypothetical protein|uniref:hypothetical protein n=1 Tax=Rahnella variigena TaxID=574964 RepID=UPI001F0EE7D9|nr:hypothetical protein [Rahnella variigena]
MANLSGDLLTGNLSASDVQIVTGIDVQVVACGSVDVGENADARFLKSVWINGLVCY